jgi:uncharacterized protein
MSEKKLPAFIQLKKEGVVLGIAAAPGAKRSELVGPTPDGFLKIKLAARALEGKANSELIRFLAEHFHVRKSDIEIVSGQNSRKKRVLVRCLNADELIAHLKI